jgi:hypothetical protein
MKSVYPGNVYGPAIMGFLSGADTNDIMDDAYIEANGSCQPTKSYRWGFSFLLLWISVLLTALWAFGMHVMWLDAYFECHSDRAHRYMGTHRAALDFASAIIKDMGNEAPPENASEKELVTHRKKALNGGEIPRLYPTSSHGDAIADPVRTRAGALHDWLDRRRWGRVLRRYKWPLIVFVAFGVALFIFLTTWTFGRWSCVIYRCRPQLNTARAKGLAKA